MLKTKRFGLIGKNIDYSFSKQYFSIKFKKENLDSYEYTNCDIKKIEEISEIKLKDFAGFNVTIPYKEKIINFLDSVDENAKKIGAVNTIKIKNGKLVGYNTDYIGFLKSIDGFNFKNAVILGSGGACKAIAFALKIKKIPHVIFSRKSDPKFLNYSNQKNYIRNSDLIINTTPLGTFPNTNDCPPINFEYISEKSFCYDLIYNPAKTKFLMKSEKLGATIKNGLNMLQYQAEESWKIWNS